MDGRGNYADRAVSALWVIIQQFLNFCKKKCIIFQRVAEIRSTGRSVENKGLGGRCQQRKTNERDGEESNTEEQRRARCFVITTSEITCVTGSVNNTGTNTTAAIMEVTSGTTRNI